MKIKYKDMIEAFAEVEDKRNISMDVILEALTEAMAKAFKKDAELNDIDVYATINEKEKTIDIYQNYTVVEEVEDDELEISLEDAKEFKKDAVIGDVISQKKEITGMSRAAANLAKSVVRQKIREAEKDAVYNEYISQLHDLVFGVVESVKPKFVLVNLGKTVALMPNSATIPTETLKEDDMIRVVITDVKKDGKGSQVLVSRADPMLVKRLFENEVPEIYDGIVEIKAISREAGERTKMAVFSRNPDIDPIGACIGQRGQRVQSIIDDLHGEKIDIFEWNDDITELVTNSLAPAEIDFVVPQDDDNILVLVNEDQLSLAIGKQGKNVKLAVKLTGKKIDIKTKADLEEMGLDYETLKVEAEAKREEIRIEAEKKRQERLEAEAREEEEKRLAAAAAKIEAQKALVEDEEDAEFIPEEMQEIMSEKLRNEIAQKPVEEEKEETTDETVVEETTTEEVVEEAQEEVVVEEKPKKEPKDTSEVKESKKHADLEEMAAKNTYVSKYEDFTESSSKQNDTKPKRKKKKNDDDDYKVSTKDLEELKKNLSAQENLPIYTEEELAEIEAEEYEDEYDDDIDYDEYEEYYDDEDDN